LKLRQKLIIVTCFNFILYLAGSFYLYKKLSLTGPVLSVGLFLSLALFLVLYKIIINPILTLTNLITKFSIQSRMGKREAIDAITSIRRSDELGILAHEFASTIGATWQKDQEIKKVNQALETRVQSRTMELLELTEKLQQEINERRSAEEAVMKERQRLEIILDGNPIPTFVIDLNHNVVIWNRACENLTGIIKQVALGRPLNQQIFYQNETMPALADLVLDMDERALQQYYREKKLFRSNAIAEAYEAADQLTVGGVLKKNIYFLAARLRDDSGKVIGAIETLQDITEKEQLQVQLQRSQKMEAVGTLAAGMAHEFNNILAAIQGYVQLMKMKIETDNPLAEYIVDIDTSCQRAAGLTRKMLTFSRSEIGEKKLVKINHLVDGMHRLLRQTLPAQIELEMNLQPNLPFISAEGNQLEQVLLNLAVNARDAMPNGGTLTIKTGRVELDEYFCNTHSLARPGQYIIIEVQDTGKGMLAHVIEHIFEPFFTTKEPGKGTGLGLSIVYSIIKHYGGHILAESQLHKGSCFKIYLPVEDEVCEEVSTHEVEPVHATGAGEHILVVDDEPHLREIAKEVLTTSGYQVSEAANGQEAVNVYKEHRENGSRVDLVMLDMSMPVMDGKTCMKCLRGIDPSVPILITTGHTDGTDMLKATANGILFKPFSLSSLLQEVKKILEQKQSTLAVEAR
jgi:signal transduction histidine kinase/ActR/RegA family two-component response regulator